MSDHPPQPDDTYNYSIFNGQGDFEDFPNMLRAGALAPDFAATLLGTGQTVHLSDYWRQRDLVVEFGSFT